MSGEGGEADEEDGGPAAIGVEVAVSVDVWANALSVHTLGVDQLVVLEGHVPWVFFLFIIIITILMW